MENLLCYIFWAELSYLIPCFIVSPPSLSLSLSLCLSLFLSLSLTFSLFLNLPPPPSLPPHSFSINVGHDSDNYALHFNPRFSHGHIVCNSLSGGSWGDELKEGHFPFQDGEQFKLVLNFTNEQFYIKLPDGHMMDFPNRLGDCKYNHIMVDGDVKVISFKVK
uniref:Galectin n=1 Tax=Salmo trutta TaxID=8032 RepID=A0A674AIT7_SALTR